MAGNEAGNGRRHERSGLRFSSDRAWRDGMSLLSGNGQVLMALAGVFIFLPALGAALFLSDMQVQMLREMPQMQAGAGSAMAMQQMWSLYARVMPWVLALVLVNEIGKAAMMALLTHRHRPTVGEALRWSLRCLPTLIGAGLVLAFGCSLAALALALVAGIGAVAGAAAPALGAVVALLFAAGLLVAVTRFSLVLPVVVIDGERNPLSALAGSWRLTAGNTPRLLAFYILLIVAYLVMTIALTAVLMGLAAYAAGTGRMFTLASGVLSGAISAGAATLWIGILAAIHRQLSDGTSP